MITEYAVKHPQTEIICYTNGYKGLLLGESIHVTPGHPRDGGRAAPARRQPDRQLAREADEREGLHQARPRQGGQDPQQVAADQLIRDGVEVLHTIGGDDANTSAADLSAFLQKGGYSLTVIGLPKTVDNDVYPIQQSLGAWTAAEQGARFFENVVAESSANPRMMIVHEVMGRDCGWLTAATAQAYRARLAKRQLLPQIGLTHERLDVHAVYIPEVAVDIEKEAARLKAILDANDNVNIFISEGAGVKDIVARMEAEKPVMRDAFGHVKLDAINPGKYFADTFSGLIGAEKVLVQKSGYFARAAPANDEDQALIRKSCAVAVEMACLRTPGVVGMDEGAGGELRCCEFERIKGGKPFDVHSKWFKEMMVEIGQTSADAYPVGPS